MTGSKTGPFHFILKCRMRSLSAAINATGPSPLSANPTIIFDLVLDDE